MKKKSIALILCIFTGAFGGHHYYLGNWRKGIYRFLLTCLSIIIVLAFIEEDINALIPLACYIPLAIDFIRIVFDPNYIANYKTINFKEDMKQSIEKEMQKEQGKHEEKIKEKDRLKELEKQGIPYCPKCHSTSIQYVEHRKRLSIGRAVVGGALAGGVGAALGGLTSKKYKGKLKCLNCGHEWKL